jgi:hypothetical protein
LGKMDPPPLDIVIAIDVRTTRNGPGAELTGGRATSGEAADKYLGRELPVSDAQGSRTTTGGAE